ncbi:hypothetical protein DWG24_12925 [Dickeya zeae]|uniref:Uncharacterized protein n=1 Tax=Dickeya zeae TaxID=204042 RepID=A0AAE6Z1B2_9GAMM|nr:hypothetical protein [Dickeya zeae]QIZ51603.1 hypothetical protein DWG24_12925 [Dickeya zeae]
MTKGLFRINQSLTPHKKSIAVVARKKLYNYIGIDCQNIFGQDVFGEIKGMIVNLAEVAYLSRVDVPMVELMTLGCVP